jgi:hypothetical protein
MSHSARLMPAKGLLTVLVGLTLLAVPACKSQKEEPAATPSQTAAAPAATATVAPETQPATASETGAMTTKADTKATASDAAAEKGVKAQKPPQPGLVWVNLKNGTYHTETSPHYGKTAQGKWMKESKAIAKGYKKVGTPKAATTSDAAAAGSDVTSKPKSH